MSTSPLLARLLLRILLPPADREFVIGDLEEVFATQAVPSLGQSGARRWYWRCALASIGAQRFGRRAKATPPSSSSAPLPKHGKERPTMAEVLGHDLRHIRRFLGKNPGFTAVAAITLALGIGANTAVFSVLNRVVLNPLQYDEPEALVRLYQNHQGMSIGRGFVTGAAFLDYREMANGLESVTALYNYREYGFTMTGAGQPRRATMLPVSSDFFDVYRVRPHLGRAFNREEERGDASVVVLSHRLWIAYSGGDADLIGQSIYLDDEAYEVIGVMPTGFVDAVGGDVDMWIPLELQDQNATQNRGNHYLSVVARLKDGWSLDEAQSQLLALSASLEEEYPDTDEGWIARIMPLQEDVVGGAGAMLYLLLGAAGLVLLIACVNVANVSLARNLAREGELAIRSALGSGRGRLARMLMTESVTVAVIGGLAGLGLARWGVRALLALSPDAIPRREELGFDSTLFLFALGVTLLTVVLFGLIPTLQHSRLDPASSLRDQTRATSVGRRGRRIRDLLVASQVGLAIVLLVGAGLLIRSLAELNRVDLGLTPGHTTTFEVHLGGPRYEETETRLAFHQTFAERLGAIPGVEHAGAISRLPVTGLYNSWGFRHRTPEGELTWSLADVRVMEGEYFEAMGIERVQGRVFEPTDGPDAPPAVLVNEALAEDFFPGEDPIGQILEMDGREWRIEGVMENVAHDHRGSVVPKVYVHHPQFASNRNWPMFYAVTTTNERRDLPQIVRQELAGFDPSLVIHNVRPMREIMGAAIAAERFSFALMGVFAVVALVLAAVGIYGVLAFSVSQRTQEIGIRVALGADIPAVRWSVLRKGLAVVGVGTVVGLVAAFGLARLLPSVLFGVGTTDPLTYVAVPAALMVVALIAAYLPARRATKIDPMEALRLE